MDTTNVNQDDLFMARMTLDEVQEEGGILSSQQIAEGGIVMQNTDMSTNDTLIAELSQEATVVLDTEEIVDTTPEEANGKTAEANAQQTDGEDEQPDEHGLVYVTRTFTVNPQEYESDNYRPINQGATAEADQKPNETIEEAKAVEITETADGKATADEKIVLDYATYIDGSSFLCFDELSDIDYSKIAMDGGNKKPPTRANCDTTFNQCRAKNPLFCRYHGPKLLEADIKAAIRRQLRDYNLSKDGKTPFTIEVTKAKKASPNTFTVTVGCTPKQKKHVEMILDRFLHDHKGISTTDKLKEGDKDSYMQEFEMDILKADKPPKRGNIIEESAAEERDKAVEKGKVMPVVRETEEEVEEETAEGEGATEEVAETKEAETDTVSSPEEQQAAGENKDNQGERETVRSESEKDTAKESGEGKDIGEELKEQESEETAPELTPIERAEKTADIVISSGVASQEEQEVAESIKEAAKKAKQSKKIGEELKGHLDENRKSGGAGEALAVASVVGAMEKAKSETAEQEKKIQEEEKRLKQMQEQSNREAENKVKGIAAAKVESALQQMAKQIFTTADSKSGAIDKEAEKVVSDLGEYAKSKGYEGETGDEVGELVEEIKERNGRLQSMMEAFSKAVEQKGDAFHEEDVSHLAEVIRRDAGRLGDRFRVLQGLALYEKKRIDDAEKVAAEKKALEEKISGKNSKNEKGEVTPEEDAAYLKAVEEGDTEKAQQMVADAARRAGFTEEAYHGTPTSGFTEFSKEYNGSNSGRGRKWFSFTSNRDLAESYSKLGDTPTAQTLIRQYNKLMEKHNISADDYVNNYIDIDSAYDALDIDFDESEWEDDLGDIRDRKGMEKARAKAEEEAYKRLIEENLESAIAEIGDENFKKEAETLKKSIQNQGEVKRGVYNVYLKGGNKVKEYTVKNQEEWDDLANKPGSTLYSEDSDMVIVHREGEGDLYLIKNPEQIKSADPVVYDDKGNVIPLSQRFDKGRDIRGAVGTDKAAKGKEGTAESQARIEEIYKDWVEEEVPEWVNKLSAEEQMEYIGKLEKAMTTDIEEDGSAFDALLEYEERMEQEVANRKESKVEEVKPKKEEPESGTDTKKSEAEARKEQIAAARRLGMDAYKSADELKKILTMAKRHMSDPRQAQRAKDIEVILADREAKKNLPKRFVEDKAAEEARSDESVKQMMIEGLED